MEALDRAIKVLGGVTKAAYAIGVRQSAVSNWKARGVPIDKAISIETATGGAVKRYELRPDIFDAPRKGRAA